MRSQPCKHQFAEARKYRKSSVNTIPTYSLQGRQLSAAVALGQHCQLISFYSSVHQKAEEEHLKSLSISMNWSHKDIKRSFEKIATCSCETTEVATAADDNIDFSNTFQRDQAKPINRGSYEKSRDVIERVLQVTKDIKDGLHESHVTDSFIAAVKWFCSNYWKLYTRQRIHSPGTEQQLRSALHMFGKEVGVRKQKKKIRVQSTAVARRHFKFFSTRPASAGRPIWFMKAKTTTNMFNRNIIPKRIQQRARRNHNMNKFENKYP